VPAVPPHRSDFEGFCGTWTDADVRDFEARVADTERVDPEDWKFGTLKHRLQTAGTPIPINDVWIAAHATESGSHLMTRDTHFANVAGLLLWRE
jgi:predicted nucleic acid-binding protein